MARHVYSGLSFLHGVNKLILHVVPGGRETVALGMGDSHLGCDARIHF